MIAVEKFGSNFMGALRYNLKKLNHPDKAKRAELLTSTFTSLSDGMIKKEVGLIKSLRPALKKYVWHTSLNFSKDEHAGNLTNAKLLEIGLDYMRSMGYDDNQHLIVRHHDAKHPHIHLLVNRIRFDGTLVSDSNNYRKSQSALRRLEKQYNLITLQPYSNVTGGPKQHYTKITNSHDNTISAELYNDGIREHDSNGSKQLHYDVPSYRDKDVTAEDRNDVPNEQNNRLSQRALTKNEIEKTIRTGRPSDKALLQEKLDPVIYGQKLSLQEFIERCGKAGVSLLFNQASTGRVSGITYFINDFKAKGQALGNRFKWAEIIKYIDYEQDRDSQAIGAANSRTKAKYGSLTSEQTTTSQFNPGRGTAAVVTGAGTNAEERNSERENAKGNGNKPDGNNETHYSAGAEVEQLAEGHEGTETGGRDNGGSYTDSDLYSYPGIEIADDIDDEAIHGRNRQRQKKARTNRR
jgi:hypothetical protein